MYIFVVQNFACLNERNSMKSGLIAAESEFT